MEEIGGQRLIRRVIDRLSLLGNDIIVVTSSTDQLPDLGLRRVVDIYPGKGALGGIYSGLKESPSFHSLVVACDMPFLSVALLRYLMELSPGFDVVIPRVEQLVEPLHAIYSKNCLEPIEAMLQKNNLKIDGLFDRVKVRYVEEPEIERFDPQHLSFFNINSEADLEHARSLLEKERACI